MQEGASVAIHVKTLSSATLLQLLLISSDVIHLFGLPATRHFSGYGAKAFFVGFSSQKLLDEK
jgi:hypothetical protein